MSRTHIKKSIERFLERKDNKTIRIINRKRTDVLDEQLDPEIKREVIETDQWHFNLPSDLAVLSNDSGRQYPSQARIYIPGDTEVYFGNESSDVQEPSIIEVNNERWKVMRVELQAFGYLKKVFIKSQETPEEGNSYGDSF